MITRGFGITGGGIAGTIFVGEMKAILEDDPSVLLEPIDYEVTIEGDVMAELSDVVLLEPPVEWIFRDEFRTDQAAPLIGTRFSEPGPGTLTFREGDETAFIENAKLTFTGSTNPNGEIYYSQEILGQYDTSSHAGLAVVWDYDVGSAEGVVVVHWGDQAAYWTTLTEGIRMRFNRMDQTGGSNIFRNIGNYLWADDETGRLAIILRRDGAFYFRDGELLLVSNRWRHLTGFWPMHLLVTGENDGATPNPTVDNLSIVELAQEDGFEIWGDDFTKIDAEGDPATYEENFQHEADCHITYEFTFDNTDGTLDLYARWLDNANRYNFSVKQNGTFWLSEKVGGTNYNHVISGVVFTHNQNHRVDITMEGQEVRMYVDRRLVGSCTAEPDNVNNTIGIWYPGAVFTDIDWEVHPYPQLGICSARDVCPQAATTGTHPTDFIFYIREAYMTSVGGTYVKTRHDGNEHYIRIGYANGGYLNVWEFGFGGNYLVFATGAGQWSDGDDLMFRVKGDTVECWVQPTSGDWSLVGSGTLTENNQGPTFNEYFYFNQNEYGSAGEFWECDQRSNLPEALGGSVA